MFDNLNELIDINLEFLSKKEDHSEFYFEFLNIDKQNFQQLGKFNESERLAKNMREKGLIEIKKELAILTELGYEIVKNGGWSKHKEQEAVNTKQALEKSNYKEKLETELKVLQKDNLEYTKTIRAQNDRIRNLEEQIKFISLLKLYWWLIPICITIGIFIVKFWELIKK